MKMVLFLSDYEAAEEFEAVFRFLRPHGVDGVLAKPKDIGVVSANGHTNFFFKGKQIEPSLVIGYSFEDDLLPGMRLLKLFKEAGFPVLNDGETLYYGQHKDVSSSRLNAMPGVRHMPFVICSVELIDEVIKNIEFPVVAKPINGACGKGLFKHNSSEEFRSWMSDTENQAEYYVQPYIEKMDGVDYRIACVGYKAVYAYERRSSNGGWVTNLSSNGLGKVVNLDIFSEDAIRMSESASRAVGALFCGIDLAFDSDGKPFIIEANTCPAIKISKYIPGACDGLEKAFAEYLLLNHLQSCNVG